MDNFLGVWEHYGKLACMSRWTPLTDDDPLRINTAGLDERATTYKRTAIQASAAAEKLTTLATVDGWDTDSAKEYRNRAQKLAQQLEELSTGMEAASKEVAQFVEEVHHAEARARGYCIEARSAQAKIRAADADLDQHRQATPTEENAEEHRAELVSKELACMQARDSFKRIKQNFDKLVAGTEEQAQVTANRIRAAAGFAPEMNAWDHTKHFFSEIYDDHIEPKINKFNAYMDRVTKPMQDWCQKQHWWDDFTGFMSESGKIVSYVGAAIAVVAVVAFVIVTLPVTGPVAAIAASALALSSTALLVLAAASLACNVTAGLDGDSSRWGYAGMDAATLGIAGLGKLAQMGTPKNLNTIASKVRPVADDFVSMAPPKLSVGHRAKNVASWFGKHTQTLSPQAQKVRNITRNAKLYADFPPALRRRLLISRGAHDTATTANVLDRIKGVIDISQHEKDMDRKQARGEKVGGADNAESWKRRFEYLNSYLPDAPRRS